MTQELKTDFAVPEGSNISPEAAGNSVVGPGASLAVVSFLDAMPLIDWSDLSVASTQAEAVLRRLSTDKALLADLVERVSHDPLLLAMCERHELLDRMVIYDALDRGFRIRLHLSTNVHADRPHDHRFDFSTLIMRGSYRHLWYEPPGVSGMSESMPDRIRFMTNEIVGSSYTIAHDVLHATITTPDTVSLFLRGPARKPSSSIYDREATKFRRRYGQEDEDARRRRQVEAGRGGYHHMTSRLRALQIL